MSGSIQVKINRGYEEWCKESIFEAQHHEVECVRGTMGEKGVGVSDHGMFGYYGLIDLVKILN